MLVVILGFILSFDGVGNYVNFVGGCMDEFCSVGVFYFFLWMVLEGWLSFVFCVRGVDFFVKFGGVYFSLWWSGYDWWCYYVLFLVYFCWWILSGFGWWL